ncbi:ABC transporter substrate-binding protein [Noviherbaspirillum aridicola]|uniref:ABC transporter substrate-binding protein n=1 Tax=Noviherbaspirillum aridicola TaxID=2849687 RepID=A0ABQ4Q0X0_9BURK|nr:ABC transporter substrate-binding protein [Noviherbaspirillum aridicola]GIZ50440.1 ABC transporter substrate-binding protein [Noviherbaspirillum aridicola]
MFAKRIATILLACSAAGLAHAGEVRIGSVTGITGPNASTGAEGTVLVTNYLQMINDKGGINGNTLARVIKDDQYDPKKTAALTEEAIVKDNVVALVNAVGTANTIAVMKSGVLTKHKVPLLGVFSGADAIRGPGSEMIFHTRASYTDEVMKIARLSSTLGLKRVAVLYQDDGFGAGINQSIARAAADYMFEVVAKAPYKAGETDFSAHVKQIADARPQAIFLMGVPDAVIRFMKAYEAPTGAAQIYTLSFVPAKLLSDSVGEKKVRGVGISQVVPNPNSVTLPLAREFQAFLKSPYGKGISSNPTNFEVYLNIRLLTEAIRMAGPQPTPEKVTKALTSMNGYSLAGYPISFGESKRTGSHYLDIGVIGAGGRLNY